MTHPRMVSRAARVVGFFFIAAGILAATIPLLAQAQQRVLYVSVTDKAGKPVATLSPADIVVKEDKVTREVLSIVPAIDPMQIALLVDNSTAANGAIVHIREALTGFITAITSDTIVDGKHQIALIGLASRPTIIRDYTTSQEQLLKGAQSLFAMPDSGTYLLDGIIEIGGGLTKRSAPRPVFVAVVTSGPELSDRPYEVVLKSLKASGAPLHVVKIGSANTTKDRAIVSDQGTRDSGGRYVEILTSTALTDTLKSVADNILHQYKVTYSRPTSLIPPESVTVEATKPGLEARGTPARAQAEVRR